MTQQKLEFPVRWEVAGKEIDPTVLNSALNRSIRRTLEKHGEKQRKALNKRLAGKLDGYEGPLPTIVMRKPKVLGIDVEVVVEFPEELQAVIDTKGEAERIS